MSAGNSLGPQFIPITQVLEMGSGDATSLDEKALPGDFSVKEMRHYKEHDKNFPWKALNESVASNGIKKPLRVLNMADPITGVRSDILTQGHHRALAAANVGQMLVPVHREVIHSDPVTDPRGFLREFQPFAQRQIRDVRGDDYGSARSKANYRATKGSGPAIPLGPSREQIPGQGKLF